MKRRSKKTKNKVDRKLFVFWGQPSLSNHLAATLSFCEPEKRDHSISITSMSKTLCAPNQSAGFLLKHDNLPLSVRQTFLCSDYQNCHTQSPHNLSPSDVGICPQPQKPRCRLHVTSTTGSQQVLGRKQKSLWFGSVSYTSPERAGNWKGRSSAQCCMLNRRQAE